MAARKVIVFGPTGAVGSSAARTAEALGATVVLAMRDTSKSIPGLDAEKEKQGKFERITADLTKPDTISEAVKKSGAKFAFFYLAHGMPDHMKSTIEALKSSGIEKPVFLSSFTIQQELKDVQQVDIIPWMHAQVELNLAEIYGKDGYIALRPGYFASNTVPMYKSALKKGETKMGGADHTVDCIVPEDIGRVGGTVLAKGPPQDGEQFLYLYGPQLIAQRDIIHTLDKLFDAKTKITETNEEESYKVFTEEEHLPPPFAKYMAKLNAAPMHEKPNVHGAVVLDGQLSNVEKYSGKKGTGFKEWAEKNKQLYSS